MIIEQEDAQADCQQIKERIVSRRGDQDLEAGEQSASHKANSARRKNQERNEEFSHKDARGGTLLEPARQLKCVPSEWRGQRLRFVMIVKRRQVAPRWVVAQELDASGKKH